MLRKIITLMLFCILFTSTSAFAASDGVVVQKKEKVSVTFTAEEEDTPPEVIIPDNEPEEAPELELPKTATNIFNMLLLGGFLVGIGILVSVFYKKQGLKGEKDA